MPRSRLTFALAIAGALGVAAAPASRAAAQRVEHVTVRDVRVTASPVTSSVSLPREPAITVHNRGTEARTLEIVSLASLGAAEARVHRVRGNVRRVLRPGARVYIRVSFRGEPLMSGESGLPWRRFRVRVRVDGEPAAVITTTSYMCRIPVEPTGAID